MDDLAFESLAGRGGSGVVWLATHRDGTKLAVKLLHAPNDRQFRREARTVAGLVHPGIVVVYDYGVLPADAPTALEGVRPGAAWLAMERLGPSLAELAPTLTDRERVEVVAEVLDALAHAHARGVLHLDVKPQNLLRAPDGRFRLVDFGIASVDGTVDAGFGTPGYAPPERHRRGELGPWSDVFSVGVMARDLLLRGRPDLAPWVARATERDPLRRWPSAARAARELRGRADDRGIPATWPPIVRRTDPPRSVGTGVVALRTAPFAGRVGERDALWRAYRAVATSGRGAVVRITGPPGSGRWRLACEVAWRVAELDLGVGVALTELTVPGLARALGAVPADEGRLDQALSSTVPDPRVRGAWVRALIDDREPPDDTVAALAAARLRGTGPAALAVRDPSAALDALAGRVLATDPADPVPTLLLRVGEPDDPPEDGEIRLPLPPLRPPERRWLLQRLLPLDDALATHLADEHDHPGRLRDALLAHVAAGLRETPDGFTADPAPPVEPDQRALAWVAGLDATARTALELAALLGAELREEEWGAACAGAGVAVPWAAVDDAVRAGLAYGGSGRISLDPGVRRALIAAAPDRDQRRADLAAVVAAGGDAARSARLLEEAGHPGAAAALAAVASDLNASGHFVRSCALRLASAEAYERAGDERSAAFERSWVEFFTPSPGGAEALITLGRERGWPEVEGSGHQIMAHRAWSTFDKPLHEAALRAAFDAYGRCPEPRIELVEIRSSLWSNYDPARLLAWDQPLLDVELVLYGRAAAVLGVTHVRDRLVASARGMDMPFVWSMMARVVACLDAPEIARELALAVLDACVEASEPAAGGANVVLARLDALEGDAGSAAARLAAVPKTHRTLTRDLIAAHRGDPAQLVDGLRAYLSMVHRRPNFDARWQHPVFVEAQRLLPAGPDRDRVRAIAESMDAQLRSAGVIASLPDW